MIYKCNHCGELFRVVSKDLKLKYCTECAGTNFVLVTAEELEHKKKAAGFHITDVHYAGTYNSN